jgi:hypothetical protein
VVGVATTDFCEDGVAVERPSFGTGAGLEVVRYAGSGREAALAEGAGYVGAAVDFAVEVLGAVKIVSRRGNKMNAIQRVDCSRSRSLCCSPGTTIASSGFPGSCAVWHGQKCGTTRCKPRSHTLRRNDLHLLCALQDDAQNSSCYRRSRRPRYGRPHPCVALRLDYSRTRGCRYHIHRTS